MILRSLLALGLMAAPVLAQQASPDPHTRVVGIFETVCLRGALDFSDSTKGFFSVGLAQNEDGFWVDPLSEIIGAATESEGGEQQICSVALVNGDFSQFAQALPAVLPGAWGTEDMRRFEGSDGRSDIYMTEGDEGIRAAWVDVSEGNIAVMMTTFTRTGTSQ